MKSDFVVNEGGIEINPVPLKLKIDYGDEISIT